MKRRAVSCVLGALLALPALAPAQTAPAKKVLRYAFEVAESSFDPVKINDLYSRTLTPHIFEAPYQYDHLARPIKVKPLTADGPPQHSEDYRTWTVKIRPGILFADDPAFKGRKRELVAQDYVYTWKRYADPANKSPIWFGMEEEKFVGLKALREEAQASKKPFDYDREIEGVRALDRYTLQFKLEEPRPRFAESLAASDLFGAVAREVVEFYGDQIDGHPVGTGPFKLVQWRRSSLLVLERNPDYRERFYDAEPAPDDAEGQALLARFKGRRLPMIDRVEISIIEEQQPRWLAFAGGEADYIDKLPNAFINIAMPGGKLAPNLARQGLRAYQQLEPGQTFVLFNMEDPVIGGYTPAQVALRRAFALGLDTPSEIRQLRFGQGLPAQGPYIPFTTGYDPKYKSEFGDFDPARAKGLLDVYGFVDRDGDGWRERPDGSALELRIATQPDQRSRQIDELMRKDLDRLGLRSHFETAQWPENLKSARAGSLMVWSLGSSAAGSDGAGALARYESSQIGGQNMARFKLPEFDRIVERARVLPDGPEREALFDRARQLALAYMPYKFRVNRVVTDMSTARLVGYRRPVFWQEWWHYVDLVDPDGPANRDAKP